MKKIIFDCDLCGQSIEWDGIEEPKVTYQSWRYADVAGGSSSASNQIHTCSGCARFWLERVLTCGKTIEEVVGVFAENDKSRQSR